MRETEPRGTKKENHQLPRKKRTGTRVLSWVHEKNAKLKYFPSECKTQTSTRFGQAISHNKNQNHLNRTKALAVLETPTGTANLTPHRVQKACISHADAKLTYQLGPH